MNQPATNPLVITTEDHAKLALLLRSAAGGAQQQLRSELARAVVLDRGAIPPNVVTMGSRVEFEDLATGEVEDYTLTFPEQANVDERRLSVLAPIGTALIGSAEGQEVSWPTPGGARQIRIRRVVQPTISATPVGLTLPLALQSPA